ncbi:MAG: glycosyltransferase family 2 protein [Methylovulum sp.]|nr:glycosyltransferase family 2 protein [Methylovulum sp.]
MRLFGIMLSKNEGDVIEHTLNHLRQMNCFEKIFFYDTGSKDNTFESAKKYADLLHNPQQTGLTFSDQLKFDLLYTNQEHFKEGDWFAIIDSDEFYVDNPLDIIRLAEAEKATCIKSLSAQFYITEQDKDIRYNNNISPELQRSHYLINWGEVRLMKHIPAYLHNEKDCKSSSSPLQMASKNLLLKHYQYRSPEQIQLRINTRLENHKLSNNWGHIHYTNWEDYIVPSKLLHKYDESFKYGLPDNLNLYRVTNNPAYTHSGLNWLNKNGFLQEPYVKWLKRKPVNHFLYKLIFKLFPYKYY